MALLMAMLLTIGNIPVSVFAAEPQLYAMDGETVAGADDEIFVDGDGTVENVVDDAVDNVSTVGDGEEIIDDEFLAEEEVIEETVDDEIAEEVVDEDESAFVEEDEIVAEEDDSWTEVSDDEALVSEEEMLLDDWDDMVVEENGDQLLLQSENEEPTACDIFTTA